MSEAAEVHSEVSQSGDNLSSPRRAERRQLTILFCDLIDSTGLSERLDPEEYRQVILNYHEVAQQVINPFGGHIGNYLGDGLLAYFGYPEGLEDAPMAGVRAGLGIIKAVAQANQNWAKEGRNVIEIRIGVHTGLAIVDEHLALGETVNIAARLEGLAPRNGLVISPHTLKLVQGWFEFKSIGKHVLKGISEPMEVFQILKESGVKSRFEVAKGRGLSPLVGRQLELEQLIGIWQSSKNGNGQAVLLNGEAGIGKSRLVDTLEDHVEGESGNTSLVVNCSSYHQNSAFYPIIELFHEKILGIETNNLPQDKLNKLEQLVPKNEQDGDLLISLIAEFLSIPTEQYPPLMMSPFVKRGKTMESLTQSLLNYSRPKPMLLVVEDLHWADASTLEWLSLLFTKLHQHPILVLCTTRPGLNPKWIEDNDFDSITLERLSTENIAEIALHQTNGKILPLEVLDQIAAKTEGVPLFVEELTKMILESDLLVEKDHGFEIDGVLSALAIPSTLQDSLLSRLDRLSNIREVVYVGSVLGREFSFDMLKAILPRDSDSLKQSLAQLVNAELVTLGTNDKEPVYQFKHALIRDTAYGSMLKSRRRQLHQRVSDALQQKFSNISLAQPELLAYHLTEAGMFSQAIPHWLSAGQLASKQNATTEAISHLEKGIKLLPHIKDDVQRNDLELDFTLTLGGTFVVSLGFPHPKVKETFKKAGELAQNMEVTPKLALVQINLLSYYFNTEDYQSADELRSRLTKLAEDPTHGYWFELINNHFGVLIEIVKGDFNSALKHYQSAIELFDPSLPFPWELTPSGYIEIGVKSWIMVCYQITGLMDQAKKIADHHPDYIKDHRDPITLYHIYTFPPLYKLLAREWQAAETGIAIYLPIVRRFGDPVFILTAEVYYYVAKAFQGDKKAFEQAAHLMHFCLEIGFKTFTVCLSPLLAEQYYQNGEYEPALTWIDKILEHANHTGTHIQTAELYRIKGLTFQALGKSDDQVEELFSRALEVSRDQSAKTFELRASKELAQFWHQQGKSQQAYELLAGAYNWFTEGYDSVDLKEAKSVLATFKPEVHKK
ncbi:MAG: adenylate cyclase [Cyclobacteriaceae bacterium]|nr:MAG: adenylate cyclase [Cyclobacteriaceae bacterium]